MEKILFLIYSPRLEYLDAPHYPASLLRRAPPVVAIQGPSHLSGEGTDQLSNRWLEGERVILHFSAPYDELASRTPTVSESTRDLSDYVHNTSFTFDNANSPFTIAENSPTIAPEIIFGPLERHGETLAAAEPAQTPKVPPYPQGRRAFSCQFCGKTHDRLSRARDCANQDVGLTPYRCGGGCGNTNWYVVISLILQDQPFITIVFSHAAYSSEETWRRHLGPGAQCPRWYAAV